MFDKWLKLPAHYYLRITALIILVIGVCVHNTLMSIGTIWIAANWLIEAKYKFYWKAFKATPAVWFLLGFVLLSFISLGWSNDIGFGLKDIAKKLPLFVIPFILGTSERIEKKIVFFLLYIFVGTILLTSAINYYRFNYVLVNDVDIREMSYFISHVRYSITVVLGLAAIIYLIISKKGPIILWSLSGVWLLFYALKSQTLTAYVLLLVLFLFSLFYCIYSIKNKGLKVAISIFACASIVYGLFFINTLLLNENPTNLEGENLDKETINGRKYFNDLESTERENGNLVWMYIQIEELEREWNNRSKIKYDSLDNVGQPMFGTLLRYMTSKNIRKDSVGVSKLSNEEVVKIENGCTSIRMNSGYKAKFQEFLIEWELYKNGGNPNGHSILQRAEHIKVGWSIAKSNWLFGVGIGDLNQSFVNEYIVQKSLLTEDNRHRSHNQFLSFWIALGVVGLLVFLAFLIAPMFSSTEKSYLFWTIATILCTSLFFQDMLETQAGVCIFGLFYSLISFQEPSRLEAREK